MKLILSLCLGLLTACSEASERQKNPVEANDSSVVNSSQKFFGQLKVHSGQLSDLAGNPVMLRGVSFGWHNSWPTFYNETPVKWLKRDWNVNVVRTSMGIDPQGAS